MIEVSRFEDVEGKGMSRDMEARPTPLVTKCEKGGHLFRICPC